VPTQPPTHRVPDFFPVSKAASAWRWPPLTTHPHLASRVKIEYSYTFTPPSEPSWPFLGRTFYFIAIISSINNTTTSRNGVRCGEVGWGSTLPAGRLRVRSPMLTLEFFIDIILPAALWPWSWLSSKQKWVPGIFPGG
jgi:hypothetical protein